MDKLTDKMNLDDIANYITQEMTYKEGWSFIAYPNMWTGGDPVVTVDCEFRPENSSPRDIDPRTWVIADGSFDVMPGTRGEVQEQLLKGIMGIEAHETCEFLRFDTKAPFHPHREDGRKRYSEAQDRMGHMPMVNDG